MRTSKRKDYPRSTLYQMVKDLDVSNPVRFVKEDDYMSLVSYLFELCHKIGG